MSSSDASVVDDTVRQILDAMRNAHLQMVFGDPYKAGDYVEEAVAAHRELSKLFEGGRTNEALAGRSLHRVIAERIESLKLLARESLTKPMTTHEVLAIVEKPLAGPVNP